ncbi:adenylyltransferase/cytidyltransferase family protein [Oscillatoria amoena NRMC-F 0135]|nr:adenylyltransferase/cytidyltransferase family protein [Oscillatoria amoena NRMC-F 0135]MDL5053502.1 adenylyltransferase/cytidyltransferase family protein [Oscillatoria laete-virens NRMC-F 0139]
MNRQSKAQKKKFTSTAKKCLSLSALRKLREKWRREGLVVGLTNGCFDLLHRGHVTYLQKARWKCDRLIVAVNSDHSVRALDKGPGRPLNSQDDRAFVLAGLSCVDATVIFDEPTVTRVIEALAPDHYFKGGDYTLATLNPDEKRAVQDGGGKITLIPLVPGKSTTALVKKMRTPTKS